MGLPLAGSHLRQAGKLAADRRHSQRLAMLANALRLKFAHHAVPAQGPESSVS